MQYSFQIRRVGVTFYTATVFALQFVLLKIFPKILFVLELHGSVFLFAGVIATGFIFTIFVVRETKGINTDVLEVEDGGDMQLQDSYTVQKYTFPSKP